MRVGDVLAEGVESGTQIGAQLYVAHQGRVVADLAIGHARAGVAMTTDSMMTWFSMTKAIPSCVSILRSTTLRAVSSSP